MKAAYRIEHVPQITVVDDGMIMMLWNQSLDTCEIAKRLQLKEWQVANRLLHLRAARLP